MSEQAQLNVWQTVEAAAVLLVLARYEVSDFYRGEGVATET
jgi:hypothetical protein